jgi:cell division inhibitor SepF
MATGIVRRAMVYLGLSDDDYDEHEAYEEQEPVAAGRQGRASYADEASEPQSGPAQGIRTLPRDPDQAGGGSVTVTPRSGGVVRPFTPVQNAKVHVVAPGKFADAQEIGDRFKSGQPVIVNLQAADRELGRRMIDFCSGVTYALGGSMDKVADQVFLLTPSNVEVSAEEKRRLQERGLYRS